MDGAGKVSGASVGVATLSTRKHIADRKCAAPLRRYMRTVASFNGADQRCVSTTSIASARSMSKFPWKLS